jgi:hypothetical protein
LHEVSPNAMAIAVATANARYSFEPTRRLTFLSRNVGMKEFHPAKLRQKMHIRKQSELFLKNNRF